MRKATNRLFIIYYTIYALAILEAVLGAYWQRQGPFVSELSQIGVNITTFYILFLLVSIPLALKFFKIKVKKLSALSDEEEKIARYTKYAILRLFVIGLCLFVGIFLFYFLNSISMIFCAAVAAIALVFCKPSEVRMALDLESPDEDEE